MAVIIVLKNKETGERVSHYSVDAREILNNPDTKWEFHKRLGRTAKMVESGVATQTVKGAQDGAVEFHGATVMQEDAKKAVEPPAPTSDAAVDETSTTRDVLTEKKESPQAPSGSRGGGKQEPAKKTEK
jgi:hypothetical protein